MAKLDNPGYPSYLGADLDLLAKEAEKMLACCAICPRRCQVNRLKNQRGFCKTGVLAKVSTFLAHHGEEPPISAKFGSGTIFFSHCNMSCIYCQNYPFSQEGEGKEVTPVELASFMLELQKIGCHNINLVTPTHVMPQILKALSIAVPQGLKIPLVYNSGGYELASVIKFLEGVVDIYLPDMRYSDSSMAVEYSSAPNYPKYNQEAVKEMHRQVGIANIDNQGIIKRGLVIRHLVLPHGIAGTQKIMKFIAQELSPDTYVSLMSQYHPYYRAFALGELNRALTHEEYENAKLDMEKYGLHNGWIQEEGGLERLAGIHLKAI